MNNLLGMTTDELRELVVTLGEPAYRANQISRWIYHRGARSISEMTDIPKALAGRLSEAHTIARSRIAHKDVAPDGTVKYLLTLPDGEEIESVYLPYEGRVSVCISSQVGCPAGCTFCATAQGGLARNMRAGEIVDEILALAEDNPDRRISHVVFMGMGEPLLNYDESIRAVRLLTSEVGLSARHLTISTVGVVPGIRRLAEEALPVTLALSLHAPDDDLRERLIPTARKWRLADILDACRCYYEATRRNLTFEYLLIGQVNDDPDQARQMARLLGDLPGNVNLIPFNYVDTEHGFRRPTPDRVAAFRAALEAEGRITTQRMERGHAISAACGQLRRTAGALHPRKAIASLSLKTVGSPKR